MSEPNDGGPAFPNILAETVAGGEWDAGMSLRDYFAAKAMQGLLSAESETLVYRDDQKAERFGGKTRWTKAAESAYLHADAMLAARKGGRR